MAPRMAQYTEMMPSLLYSSTLWTRLSIGLVMTRRDGWPISLSAEANQNDQSATSITQPTNSTDAHCNYFKKRADALFEPVNWDTN